MNQCSRTNSASRVFKLTCQLASLNKMGPKKKERDTDHSSSSRGGTNNGHGRAETVQADHELFLQAFESKELDVEFYILVFLTIV